MSARPCITRIASFSVDIELPDYCVGLLDDKCSSMASSYIFDKLVEIYKKLGSSLDDLMVSIDQSWIGIIVYDNNLKKTYWELYVYNKPRLEVYLVEIKCKEWCEMPVQLIKEM